MPVNRLLIVDDDRGLVTLLKRFLEGEGFSRRRRLRPCFGTDGCAFGEHELIILDVMLPGGTGSSY